MQDVADSKDWRLVLTTNFIKLEDKCSVHNKITIVHGVIAICQKECRQINTWSFSYT